VSEKLGVGVFSSKTIGKDETIIEINGEVLDFPTIQSDVQEKLRVNDNYLYIHQLDENHWIDAEYEGNISRYINHSCKPNAKLKKWTV
jgi:histone-lysine N-methyltransferase SETD2